MTILRPRVFIFVIKHFGRKSQDLLCDAIERAWFLYDVWLLYSYRSTRSNNCFGPSMCVLVCVCAFELLYN